METEILTVNPVQLNLNKIRTAVEYIQDGEIVAFPTDTIYGIGCDVFIPEAVENIYSIKNRSLDKPINVLVSSQEQIYDIAKNVKSKFFKLVEEFWPGPLTIVVEKNSDVPDIVTSNLNTVGVRMPNNPIVISIIDMINTPLATTSANIAEEESAVTAEKVLEYFNGKIPCVIDGGRTDIGEPSTIVDIASDPPRIIRQGAISSVELRKILSNIRVK
ncbi:MAG: L-threonylcarbamoyladenylate synthase [Candidatus Thorarchaeota archaeon]